MNPKHNKLGLMALAVAACLLVTFQFAHRKPTIASVDRPTTVTEFSCTEVPVGEGNTGTTVYQHDALGRVERQYQYLCK